MLSAFGELLHRAKEGKTGLKLGSGMGVRARFDRHRRRLRRSFCLLLVTRCTTRDFIGGGDGNCMIDSLRVRRYERSIRGRVYLSSRRAGSATVLALWPSPGLALISAYPFPSILLPCSSAGPFVAANGALGSETRGQERSMKTLQIWRLIGSSCPVAVSAFY